MDASAEVSFEPVAASKSPFIAVFSFAVLGTRTALKSFSLSDWDSSGTVSTSGGTEAKTISSTSTLASCGNGRLAAPLRLLPLGAALRFLGGLGLSIDSTSFLPCVLIAAAGSRSPKVTRKALSYSSASLRAARHRNREAS